MRPISRRKVFGRPDFRRRPTMDDTLVRTLQASGRSGPRHPPRGNRHRPDRTRYTMIPTRVEKLKFIVEEMQLAFYLTIHLTDPFVARTLARHILIRAENFIKHAQGLRKPLNDAGYETRDFHTTKEAYASAFEEYKASRHRLSAHVQDLDFAKRIELRNDIQLDKVSFFVDGAQG